MLRHCHCVVVWSCWNLGHCIIDHVVMLALEHFWSVESFGHGVIWTMLVAYGISAMLVICDVVGWTLAWILGALKLWNFGNVGNLHCLLDELWLEFWEHWSHEKFVVYAWLNKIMMNVEDLWACVIYGKILWVVSMSMEKFCENRKFFVDMVFWLQKYFCCVCDVGSWKNFVVTILDM